MKNKNSATIIDTGMTVRFLTLKDGSPYDVVEFPYALKKDGSFNSQFQFWLQKALQEGDKVIIDHYVRTGRKWRKAYEGTDRAVPKGCGSKEAG
ncbi:MAG: hypothetical protein ABIJ57_01015 [Pseudomonadota bacterium]